MNIYEKLVEVRKEVPYLQKENQGHQYKFVSSSQVLANVRAKMDELKLLLIPSITNKKVTFDKNTKGNTEIFTELDLTFTWINAEKPDDAKIECTWYGQGMDTAGEKGVGKAVTYAEKYFLLKFFNIATDKDDPDSFQSKHEETPKGKGQDKDKDKSSQGNPDKAKEIKNLFGKAKAIYGEGYAEKVKPVFKDITGKEKSDEWTDEDVKKIKEFLVAEERVIKRGA